MVNWKEIKDTFEKHNCKFLISEDEFNKTKHSTVEKYKYIASCGHENEVWFNVFQSRLTGVNCPNCVHKKNAEQQKEKSKTDPNSTFNLEFNSIKYIIENIENKFDFKYVKEGCMANLAIQPKNYKDDLWIMIIVKSTIKPTRDYAFKCNTKYKNCIIICICDDDKKMWCLDSNKINVKFKIAIGLKNSKYSDYEITLKNITEVLQSYFDTYPKFNLDTINTPISKSQQIELEYTKYREDKINLNFIANDQKNLVYDFILNGFKVQEKIGNIQKNKNGTNFTLAKNNGTNNKNRKFTSYKKGDADFYWLNIPDKKHFYIFPENILIQNNYINTETKKAIYLNPITNENSWDKEYLFDYTNVDINKIKKMFNIN
jgi:hypothetical protein